MVQTRSGPKGDNDYQTKNHCHHDRRCHMKQVGGRSCSKCGNLYCMLCLTKKYEANTWNGEPSLWVCYQCRGCCLCDACKKPKQPTQPRRKIKKKTKQSCAERQLRKELELKDASLMQMQRTIDEGIEERKKLTLRILQLQGNCRVFSRVRPVFPSDGDATVEFFREKVLVGELLTFQHNGKLSKREFDKVFLADSKQEDIFAEMTDLVQTAIDGLKVSVFTYGQTGSGKTFTMLGEDGEKQGLVPRAVEMMFQQREKLKQAGWVYNIKVSMLEIYAEHAYDLLTEARMRVPSHQRKPLDIQDFQCPALVFESIHNEKEFAEVLELAKDKRVSSSTTKNTNSSRSHLIVTLRLFGENGTKRIEGILNLIDLAGSERTSKTGLTDKRQQTEANDINTSLVALQQVFLSILNNGVPPYRQCTLTKLLKPCLDSDKSRNLMILNLSPAASSISDTFSALEFANCVHKCVPANAKKKPCLPTPMKTPQTKHLTGPNPKLLHTHKKHPWPTIRHQ